MKKVDRMVNFFFVLHIPDSIIKAPEYVLFHTGSY